MELPDHLKFLQLSADYVGADSRDVSPAAAQNDAPGALPWRVNRGSLTDPAGVQIPLVRHGLNEDRARRTAMKATVLSGRFPRVEEVTADPDAVESLLGDVSSTGALFTVFASLYSDGSREVLLLDYLC